MGTRPTDSAIKPPFEHDYFRSRARFNELAEGKGGDLSRLVVPAPFCAPFCGDELTIDIASFGRLEAPNKLITIAGTHGVEAPVGAAIHAALLSQLEPLPTDLAVVFVHCLNPYGFAMARRTNGSNVDLNRNSILIESERAGAPDRYDDVRDFLCPPTSPSLFTFLRGAAKKIVRHGFPTLKQAITGGQYDDPKGLFYGGSVWQPELKLLRTYLTEALSNTERVITIDTHSGLGKYGTDKILSDETEVSPSFLRLSSVFGIDKVQGIHAFGSISSETKGSLSHFVADCFPGASVDYACHEFGTYKPLRMLYALVKENCEFFRKQSLKSTAINLENVQRRQILQNVFCPNNEKWHNTVVVPRGREVFRQALSALA